MMRIELRERGIVGIRAANPGPLTLSGTNTWIVGRDPAWVVDPGPSLPEHVDAVAAVGTQLGGLGGIALTHDHADHSGALAALRERFPDAPVAAGGGDVDTRLAHGDEFGPLRALATPGHAPDHLAFVIGDVAMTGDAVLGEGSVFIGAAPGAMTGYLAALEALRALRLAFLCPGHGPIVRDPEAKLSSYIEHRLDRERRLLAALDRGRRGVQELLDEAWSDVPASLRAAATLTLAAHLDKLAEEGRLPDDVQRPPSRHDQAWLDQESDHRGVAARDHP